MKVFIDTSVLFAAVKSKTGASARVLVACKKKEITGYISNYVIAELKKNSVEKFDQKEKQRLHIYLQQANLTKSKDPDIEVVHKYSTVIKSKDAPVLAAAVSCKAEMLLTLDTGDFKKPSIISLVESLKIMTPREFVTSFLHQKKRF